MVIWVVSRESVDQDYLLGAMVSAQQSQEERDRGQISSGGFGSVADGEEQIGL